MKESLGLETFFNRFPERAFDVGICEEHASVLCSSMAAAGLKPYYAIYSTFLQRAFDEIIHDASMMDLPVTFCIDRAGISGADGETHQGVFDLSYLSLVPNLSIVAPKDTEEFKKVLRFSESYAHPLAIRYPRAGKVIFSTDNKEFQLGKWEYLNKTPNATATVLAVGERCLTIVLEICKRLEKEGIDVDVVNASSVKPLDVELLKNIQTKRLLTVEDNVLNGGFGSLINLQLTALNKQISVRNFAYRDQFIPHGGIADLQKEYGVSPQEIESCLRETKI
jgi:1-deoxy-D-xylulose-5-phosphate synthase